MKVHEFITVFYTQIWNTYKQQPYVSFGLVCIGIEFLGKCLDDKNSFYEYSVELSKKQYNAALELMPDNYKKIQLRSELRNWMLHSLIPGKALWLTERGKTKYKHLQSYIIHGRKRWVLIFEDFYDDFKRASDVVIGKIKKGELVHQKITDDFIVTKE